MIKDYIEEKNDNEEGWIEYIIHSLQGTCNGSLDDYLEEYNAKGYSEDKLLLELDNEIFLCTCGWWCDISESNDCDGEQVCDDCAGD